MKKKLPSQPSIWVICLVKALGMSEPSLFESEPVTSGTKIQECSEEVNDGLAIICFAHYDKVYFTYKLGDIDLKIGKSDMIGIDNDIYSIIDACPNSMEMWKAVERLKQCESINVQDPKTNLYWEFEKFTSLDGESLNSYYLRFVTLVKQREQLKTIFYHKLYDILKQHQNEVNEIRAERQERTTNPLTLISQQKLVYYPQPNTTHYTQSSSTRSQAATKNRDKAITNSPPLTYDPEPKVVADDDASLKEKEIDKLVALISMSFKKIYKPTSNNLISSSNTRNTNVDNTPRSNRQTGRYDNQRAVNVVGARENVGTQVVQQTGIQCYNCKEFGHVSKEYNLDDEPEDQELEAHYMYMEKIQEVTLDDADNFGPIFDVEPLQK
ncbi:hypothetical protein Tco_0438462, partial [Tanacetum coccineum]